MCSWRSPILSTVVSSCLRAFVVKKISGPFSPRQQQAAADRPAAHTHHGHFAIGDLPRAALTAQLAARLGEKSEAMQASAGQLPAPRIQRQRAAEPDPPALDEGPTLAALAEAEGFDPR